MKIINLLTKNIVGKIDIALSSLLLAFAIEKEIPILFGLSLLFFCFFIEETICYYFKDKTKKED